MTVYNLRTKVSGRIFLTCSKNVFSEKWNFQKKVLVVFSEAQFAFTFSCFHVDRSEEFFLGLVILNICVICFKLKSLIFFSILSEKAFNLAEIKYTQTELINRLIFVNYWFLNCNTSLLDEHTERKIILQTRIDFKGSTFW